VAASPDPARATFALSRFGSPDLAPKPGSSNKRRVPDEWVAGAKRSRRLDAGHRSRLRRVSATVLVLALAGGAVALMTTSHEATPPVAGRGTTPRYDAGGWVFSADFPSAPTVTHFSSSLGGQPYTVTLYSSVSARDDMIVGVYPFPVGKATMSAATFLRREITDAHRSPVKVHLQPGTSTTVQGLPSVRLATKFDGASTSSLGVVILDGHVAYEIVVTGPSSTVGTGFRQALSSFRIVDPARAIVTI
jgi:hypothetical protein